MAIRSADLEKKYIESMPEVTKPAEISDVASMGKEGYKWAKGGSTGTWGTIKGILGALTGGLSGLAGVANTAVGKQYMAGLSQSPYAAQSYLQQSEQQKASDEAQKRAYQEALKGRVEMGLKEKEIESEESLAKQQVNTQTMLALMNAGKSKEAAELAAKTRSEELAAKQREDIAKDLGTQDKAIYVKYGDTLFAPKGSAGKSPITGSYTAGLQQISIPEYKSEEDVPGDLRAMKGFIYMVNGVQKKVK